MDYQFSDTPHIEAAARILDRACAAVQILALSSLAGLAIWHLAGLVAL